MKLFLMTAFSSKVDSDGVVLAEFRAEVEAVLDKLRGAGHDVFCAIEAEHWKMGDEPPEVGTKLDLDEVKLRDVIIGLADDLSAGMHFELGYAAALGKRVILVLNPEVKPGWFITGAINLGVATRVSLDGLIVELDRP